MAYTLARYAVYVCNTKQDTPVFVREGITIRQGLILGAVCLFLINMLVTMLGLADSEYHKNIIAVFAYTILALVLSNASDIIQYWLRIRGYRLIDIVSGYTKMEAQRRFFEQQSVSEAVTPLKSLDTSSCAML